MKPWSLTARTGSCPYKLKMESSSLFQPSTQVPKMVRSHLPHHLSPLLLSKKELTLPRKDFVYGRDFHDHLASHNKEKKHVCTVCGNRYARRSSLLQHRRLHDPDGHKCHTCENFFPTDARLKEHQVVHTGETQHVCDVCQKKFKYKRGLITHMRHLHPQGDERPAKQRAESSYTYPHLEQSSFTFSS
uniref:C2H2-type domain-containing protein n=1 Tax=Branchiostoma floridae TaxID=7739 RepID=C3ZZK6_BRAFL|eukprot:XP_002586010.1 hypothetical protein BRAFLDRAFT_110209 [Branchiostoma floridae]